MARILFVDDDALTLKMLCRIAEIEGHEPLTARSGAEALERAATLKPDLILLDMQMPDQDGLEVLKALRAQPQTTTTPVAVLSAGYELDAAEAVRAAGGQAYLTKPLEIDALRQVIADHVQR